MGAQHASACFTMCTCDACRLQTPAWWCKSSCWLLLIYILAVQVDDGEPVWRRLLRLHLNHINPDVTEYATSKLAEWG
jgi:hypothetical protein